MRIDCRPKNIHRTPHPIPSSRTPRTIPLDSPACVFDWKKKSAQSPNKNQHKMCQHLYVATPQGNSSEKCVPLWQRLASPSILAGLRGWLLGTTCFPMAQDAYLCQRSGRKGKSIFMGRKHTHKQIMSHRSPVERTTEEKSTFCVGLTSFL